MSHGKAGSSSGVTHEDLEDDGSFELARRLQEEADAALAAQLMAEEQRPARPAASAEPSGGALPVAEPVSARLAAPAHKLVAHLGRATGKKIAQTFRVDGSMRSLLQLLDSPERARVLELIDPGQRDRVEAECAALRIDLLPG